MKEEQQFKSFARSFGVGGFVTRALFTPLPYIRLSSLSVITLLFWGMGTAYVLLIVYGNSGQVDFLPVWCNIPALFVFLLGYAHKARVQRIKESTNLDPPLAYQRFVPVKKKPIQSKGMRLVIYGSLALWFATLISWRSNLAPLTPEELVAVVGAPDRVSPGIAYVLYVLLGVAYRILEGGFGWFIGILTVFTVLQVVPFSRWILKETTILNRFVLPIWVMLNTAMLVWLVTTYPFAF